MVIFLNAEYLNPNSKQLASKKMLACLNQKKPGFHPSCVNWTCSGGLALALLSQGIVGHPARNLII